MNEQAAADGFHSEAERLVPQLDRARAQGLWPSSPVEASVVRRWSREEAVSRPFAVAAATPAWLPS